MIEISLSANDFSKFKWNDFGAKIQTYFNP